MSTDNQLAREQAFATAAEVTIAPTTILSYQSQGSVLVIGAVSEVMNVAKQVSEVLPESRIGLIIRDNEQNVDALSDQVNSDQANLLWVGQIALNLNGHLGQFELTLQRDGQEIAVTPLLGWQSNTADLIIDLSDQSLLDYELPPFGYFAVSDNSSALEEVLEQLPDLVGEFEKAKYFSYDASICAHGRSGIGGCTRCIDACPAGAITSLVERIEIDPYYCQGGGACATACPSGAITYQSPQPSDSLNRIRVLLRRYLDAGGEHPILLFHDAERGQQDLADIDLPAHVLPLLVEEIGSVGMDTWFGALAYGASRVLLLDTIDVPKRIRTALNQQLEIVHCLLDACGYPSAAINLIDKQDLEQFTVDSQKMMPIINRANFAGSNEKRNTLFFALDTLIKQASAEIDDHIELPTHAPFGTINVNTTTCTLCMACASVCPVSAIVAGGDEPRLDFIEANCVQCGICEQACPENAITLQARYNIEREQRMQRRVLNQEAPFHCISCGKAFATQSAIAKITAKLTDHWMFSDDKALQRLKMCGDCRVKNMFEQDYHQSS